MKFRFRLKKRNSVLISVFASATFVWLAITRLGLPKEKVVAWLITLVFLLLILIALAAVTALLLRFVLNRHARQFTGDYREVGSGNQKEGSNPDSNNADSSNKDSTIENSNDEANSNNKANRNSNGNNST